MSISLSAWQAMLSSAANRLLENADELSRIDGAIGDGDHGVTISRIARLILEKTAVADGSLSAFFNDLGWDAINIQGGSAGPLWGTFLMGIGASYEKDETASLSAVLQSGLEELETISSAREGDKTMMDALIPAIRAAASANSDGEALQAAAKAADEGADKTKDYIAKFGRAKNYKEQSLGFKDAGACSIAILFEGLSDGYNQYTNK